MRTVINKFIFTGFANFCLALLLIVFATPTLSAKPVCGGGIGGTGKSNEEQGLGGTGKQDQSAESEDGIGGTGHTGGIGGTGKVASEEGSGIGGTGIIGTIASFGSICVNGIRVKFAPKTEIRVNGKSISKNQLKIGQLVKIETYKTNKGIFAKKINVDYIVSGEITAINVLEKTVAIMGQLIKLGGKAASKIKKLKIGDYLHISGLRTPSGIIDGTYIQASKSSNQVQLKGRVTHIGDNHIVVNGKRVNLSITQARQLEYALKLGQLIKIRGEYNNSRLIASDINIIPKIPFKGRYKRFSLQGYAIRTTEENVFKLFNTEIHLNLKTNMSAEVKDKLLKGNSRVRVSLHIDENRRVVVDDVEIEARSIDIPKRRGLKRNGTKSIKQPKKASSRRSGSDERGSNSNRESDDEKSGRSTEERDDDDDKDDDKDSDKSGGLQIDMSPTAVLESAPAPEIENEMPDPDKDSGKDSD